MAARAMAVPLHCQVLGLGLGAWGDGKPWESYGKLGGKKKQLRKLLRKLLNGFRVAGLYSFIFNCWIRMDSIFWSICDDTPCWLIYAGRWLDLGQESANLKRTALERLWEEYHFGPLVEEAYPCDACGLQGLSMFLEFHIGRNGEFPCIRLERFVLDFERPWSTGVFSASAISPFKCPIPSGELT